MSIHKVADLIKKFGKSKQYFYTYKKRGKLIIENGNVDDNIALNNIFLSKLAQRITAPTPTPDPAESTPPEPKKTRKTKKPPADVLDLQLNMDLSEHDTLRNKSLKKDLELKDIRIAKIKGDSMSTKTVHLIFEMTFKTISTEFYNAIDNYTTIMIERIGGKREDYAEMKISLKELVTNTVKKGMIKAEDDINDALKEQAENIKIR